MTNTTNTTNETRRSGVVTYRLAYLNRDVDLCDECLARDDHGAGVIGQVQHGLHDGWCEGAEHLTILGATVVETYRGGWQSMVDVQTDRGTVTVLAGVPDYLVGTDAHVPPTVWAVGDSRDCWCPDDLSGWDADDVIDAVTAAALEAIR